MHYVDGGTGPTVLLMHGEPTWSYLYREIIPPLVAAGYRCPRSAKARDLLIFGRTRRSILAANGEGPAVLKRIDCVMLKVADLDKATEYYTRVMGLKAAWRDGTMVGLNFPGAIPGVGEMVLTNDPKIPVSLDVNYLVDSVKEECARLAAEGCEVIAGPFPIAIGDCAVIRDPFGSTLTLVDMTRGPRRPTNG